jgi:hypothetical protein
MLVVKYGVVFKSRSDAEQVKQDLSEHTAIQCVTYEISQLQAGQWLLLPRTLDDQPVRRKLFKIWIWQQLKAHSVQGKSRRHMDRGELLVSVFLLTLLPLSLLHARATTTACCNCR